MSKSQTADKLILGVNQNNKPELRGLSGKYKLYLVYSIKLVIL